MTERTLVLLRHAKADRPAGVPDELRPLTSRGRADAAVCGTWLARGDLRPDLVICSPAKRTRQTWQAMSNTLVGRTAPTVRYQPEAYLGSAQDLLDLLREHAGEDAHTLLLIGHNPGVSMLSELLDDQAQADSDGLRTCGLAVHRVSTWAEIDRDTCPLVTRHTPRA